MKYSQITEDAPPKDIQNLVQSIALSLIGSGKEQIGTQNLVNEIKKRFQIDIPYGVLMDMLNQLPFVQSATADTVTLGSNDADGTAEPGESSAEQVQDMAVKAASKDI
ncbi:hypothetical protein XaC1_380 [Xanthomonas phage XaC1]|nr:hypothetical protein XaC1_380 [Xanthomonas phage XaC1]